MDYRRENGYSNGNVVQVLSGNGVNVNWGSFANDQAMWATEDDYGNWNREASVETNPNSNYDGMRSGSEPPNKRSRNFQTGELQSSNKSKVIGKMFYKTKLCCKFRVGTCPYVTNCNFAHSLEELRKPPPNWQEIAAAHDEERGISSEPREEYQIPILGVNVEAQRNYKGRHCKKFYTEEGCPYGENCSFLHDEQSKTRESVAISLGPGSGGNYGGNAENGSILKPSNWKTRICNKWELTGYCPFGSKCHFAHGTAELHRFGGRLDGEGNDYLTPDGKQGALPAKTSVDAVLSSVPYNPNSDHFNMGVTSQRLSIQRTGRGPNQKWKGPDKISKVYGDWIDDL